jgi:hypothetical protein
MELDSIVYYSLLLVGVTTFFVATFSYFVYRANQKTISQNNINDDQPQPKDYIPLRQLPQINSSPQLLHKNEINLHWKARVVDMPQPGLFSESLRYQGSEYEFEQNSIDTIPRPEERVFGNSKYRYQRIY